MTLWILNSLGLKVAVTDIANLTDHHIAVQFL